MPITWRRMSSETGVDVSVRDALGELAVLTLRLLARAEPRSNPDGKRGDTGGEAGSHFVFGPIRMDMGVGVDMGMAVDLRRGEAAAFQDHRPGRQFGDEGAVMRDQDHRAGETVQRRTQAPAVFVVDPVGGLVQKQHVGAHGEQAGKAHQPFLSP